ncbi:MAG: hypothetical protein JJE46_06195 [Acidimicrobiia bacterium]|nr:hypothetical protein [Acidimicrobiia bacterium]
MNRRDGDDDRCYRNPRQNACSDALPCPYGSIPSAAPISVQLLCASFM